MSEVLASEAEECQPCPTQNSTVTSIKPSTPVAPAPPIPVVKKKLIATPRDAGCDKAPPKETEEEIVPTPPPIIPAGLCGTIKWEKDWAENTFYKSSSNDYPVYVKSVSGNPPAESFDLIEPEEKTVIKCSSVVRHNGAAYICIKEHTSTLALQPVSPDSTFEFKGAWAQNVEYKAYSGSQKASVVSLGDKKYLCIQDNTSTLANSPIDPDGDDVVADGTNYWSVVNDSEGTVGEGITYWDILVSGNATATSGGSGSGFTPEDKSLLDRLKDYADNILDWAKNADLLDWLGLAAAAAGIIWAGSEILDKLNPDQEDLDEDQNARYTGSPGYVGTPAAPTLQSVVNQLCLFAGINNADVSLLSSEPVEFIIASNTQVRSILEQLSSVYQFDMIDSGGILKFVPRNTSIIGTLVLEDMGFSTSSDLPTPYTAKRYQGITLPKSVSLTYISADIDYNNYTQKSELYTFDDGQDINITIPILLDHYKAKFVTETLMINAHLERMNYKFNTSYKWIHVEPGDVLQSPMGLIRVTKIEEVEEGILEWEVTDAGDDSAILGSGLEVQLPTPSTNFPPVVSLTSAFFLDPNNLDEDDRSIRLYLAACAFDKPGWTGCAVYKSDDNGASFSQIASVNEQSTVGLVANVTPYTNFHIWDETTTITVVLSSGTLISQSETAVLNGANRCMVGQEILSFVNATLVGPKTYELSKLIRGRQGTESFTALHTTNELFVMIDTLTRIELTELDKGKTRKFKVVSIGANIDSGSIEDVEIISNNTRMWTVGNPRSSIVNDDVILNWQPRVRFDNQLRDYSDIPFDSDFNGYGVVVLDNSDNLKSSHLVNTPTFTYTPALQLSDWGTIKTGNKFLIFQMNSKYGAGYPTVINT